MTPIHSRCTSQATLAEKERALANSGKRWSEMGIVDLTHSLDYGDTFAQTASFLCRDENEVRQKARHLGLVEHPGIRVVC